MVTYLPLGNNNFILTSNRDETPLRNTLAPSVYKEQGVKLLYPKDTLAGGTWIGLSEKNRLVCLLNGGFENHQRNSYYRLSRGVIVKQALVNDLPDIYLQNFDFTAIEPFTLILVDWNETLKTYELVWDGSKKHFTTLQQEPKIWSSSTLYNSKAKKDRESWFLKWRENHPKFTKEHVLAFHHNKDWGAKENSPVIDRSYVKTVSISCVEKKEKTVTFSYKDLVTSKITQQRF